MRLYWSLFKVRFISGLQYRSAALAGVLTQFAWGFLSIMLFKVFNTQQMDPEDLSTFFWLRQSFITLTVLWGMDTAVFASIENGEIAYETVRPVDLYRLWFIRNVAHRVSRFVLRFVPIVVVAMLLPEPFRMALPQSLAHFLWFAVSICLTVILEVAINIIMYILTMHTKHSLGVRVIFVAVFDLLDGSNIPYPFFPEIIQNILSKTFFYGLQTVPFFIYLGLISPWEGISVQLIWSVILIAAGRLSLKHSLRKIEIYGG